MADENTTAEGSENTDAEGGEERNVEEVFYDKDKSGEKAPQDGETTDEGDGDRPDAEAETKPDDGTDETPPEKSPEEAGPDETGTDKSNEKTLDYSQIKPPEGSKLTETERNDVLSFAKENGITPDAAEKLLAKVDSISQGERLRREATLKSERLGWADEARADQEIGGAKFDESIKLAQNALIRYGSKELNEWLDETGMGNNKEVIRTFSRIGRALHEGGPPKGGEPGQRDIPIEEVFYGGDIKR